jgi:hypothetical protein
MTIFPIPNSKLPIYFSLVFPLIPPPTSSKLMGEGGDIKTEFYLLVVLLNLAYLRLTFCG